MLTSGHLVKQKYLQKFELPKVSELLTFCRTLSIEDSSSLEGNCTKVHFSTSLPVVILVQKCHF